MTVTVKDIYKRVCNLECSGYNTYGSKFGGYTNPLMEQMQANVEREVEARALAANSCGSLRTSL